MVGCLEIAKRRRVVPGISNRVVAMAVSALASMTAIGGMTATAGAAVLPDGRAYELVSPPDKNGGDVVADSGRTRAATDGSAIGFISLAGFAGTLGTGIATDYISNRSSLQLPGDNGWTTHGAFPQLDATPPQGVYSYLDPGYVGEFSADLNRGVLRALSPRLADAGVKDVSNLFLRTDLRTVSDGFYQLITGCPLCAATSTALPAAPNSPLGVQLRPYLADASPDFRHIVFESKQQLTADAPPQPAGNVPLFCDMSFPTAKCRSRVYEWNDGAVRLVGRVPVRPDDIECHDTAGPACVAADASIAGQGTGSSHPANTRSPHVVSDGSDGHTRIFFVEPTDADGLTSSEVGPSPPSLQNNINNAYTGRLFMRLDGLSTAQIDVSERDVQDAYSPSAFFDASGDGSRAFFMNRAALTDDAPADGSPKLYMYDATKPSSADNLTFVSRGDGGLAAGVVATIGVSRDGRYVYFIANGQLLSGEPEGGNRIFLWHDGALTHIGRGPEGTDVYENSTYESPYPINPLQARVTPDGRHLLFSMLRGTDLTGYDHGECVSDVGIGCRQLYVYSADTDQLACASCNPSGAPATAMASSVAWENKGAAVSGWHWNRALADDGSRVFFTSGEALVSEDLNGKRDAYQYNVKTREIHLLSSGASSSHSYFLDASANGRDAFFVTRERLVGWDVDDAYDLYDARIGGGFPEPVRTAPCSADACQGAAPATPDAAAPASEALRSEGNVEGKLKPRAKACKRGFVKKRVRGKRKCVKRRSLARHRARHRRGGTRTAS